MTYTQVGIVNLALGKLGVRRIVTMADDSKQAIAASASWEYILNEVLEAHDWKFAKVRTGITYVPPRVDLDCNDGKRLYVIAHKYLADILDISIEIYTNSTDDLSVVVDPSDSQNVLIKLANATTTKNTAALIQTALRALSTVNSVSVATWTVTANAEYTAVPPADGVDLDPVDMTSGPPHPKFAYAYKLPSDFLRLTDNKPDDPAVYPIGDYPTPVSPRWYNEWLTNAQAVSSGYDIESLPDGTKCLMSNYAGSEAAPLYISYIQAVADVTRYSAHFINALAFRLAGELSIDLTDDRNKFGDLMGSYDVALNRAQAVDQSADYAADETGSDDWLYAGR